MLKITQSIDKKKSEKRNKTEKKYSIYNIWEMDNVG